MSYTAPTSTQYMPPQPPRMSGAAIASLVCGLLLCIPFLTQILAIVLGAIGLKSAGKPGSSGRGFAIAGIALGLIGLIGWAIFGALGYAGFSWMSKESKPLIAQCETFTRDLTSGNADAAFQQVDPNYITKDEVVAIGDRVAQWGSLTNFSITNRNVNSDSAGIYWTFEGTATFSSSGQNNIEFQLKKQADGSYRINKFDLNR